jgi:beta-carotene ketolase (CrtW type)
MNCEILPPTYTWKGVAIAGLILTTWALTFSYALFGPALSPLALIVTITLLTFLYVGLFITAHDSMHGLVAPHHPALNSFIGQLCVSLYALFSFSLLRQEHHRHHAHPGEPNEDPDYHDGSHASFFPWFFRFMIHYVTVWQLVRIAIAVQLLVSLCGVSHARILIYFAVPSLLSALQLFFFGTYLPHRRTAVEFKDHHRARSNEFPTWLSFLTCYHFGYHLEHHRYPYLPWWQLPSARKATIAESVAV